MAVSSLSRSSFVHKMNSSQFSDAACNRRMYQPSTHQNLYKFKRSFTTFENPIKVSSRLSEPKFKELAKDVVSYITKNIERLDCEKNESGFLRVSIPINNESKMKDVIEKLRVNYWCPDANIKIQPESIHTHPGYFESFIVKGGYSHQLYEAQDEFINGDYQLFNISKIGAKKTFSFIGNADLLNLGVQDVQKGDIVTIDKVMIHRVITTLPRTLTINAVFKETYKELRYSVYLTKNSSVDEVRTKRELIINPKSKPYLLEIKDQLSQFIENQ